MPTRKRRRISGWTIAGLALLAYLAHQWITAHPLFGVLILAVLAVAAVTLGVARFRGLLPRIRRPLALAADPHRMSPGEFEEFLARLCVRDGCTRVQVVGGANDHGADVLYVDPHGHRGLIQAKRYAPGNSVGNEHVQIVNGTYRDAHGCAHAAIVTTSHFTEPARAFAKRVGICLVDHSRLDRWARGYAAAAPWN
ncbi:restriction endonuclease [Streptomyces cupreus]|uniref:Restriction endonuclease n=1 Tax=Streptomyces cupreus TaxID=2759956 RepID=A0A7X1J7L6_9ACTN|nr:restriction endonuclease [Streptomyces cupreus]MBC2903162.1 restriction endonuclease [Streptomyces cupreus]